MEAIMEPVIPVEPGAAEPVVEPTMAQIAAGEPAEPITPPEPAAEPTPGDPPTPVDPPSAPAQDAVQKRINKITADKYAEKRRADELQAKLDAQVSKPTLPTDAPQLEDFDYDDGKYQEALIQYQVQKALETQQTLTQQQQAEQARQKVADDYFDNAAKYVADHPEYDEDVKALPIFNQDTLNTIYKLGPQVTHYLAKNLDVASEVASASLDMAAVKLGQISMGLTADTKTVKPTSAPEPPTTLKGGASISKAQEDMSMDEIMALP